MASLGTCFDISVDILYWFKRHQFLPIKIVLIIDIILPCDFNSSWCETEFNEAPVSIQDVHQIIEPIVILVFLFL